MRAPEIVRSRARSLRRAMTLPEVALWRELRLQRVDGFRFRRQHPLGPYVLDFYCPRLLLCVEVDGWGHNMGDQPVRDARRDEWLEHQGVHVLRYPASEVLRDAAAVADSVWLWCGQAPSVRFAATSPVNGGG